MFDSLILSNNEQKILLNLINKSNKISGTTFELIYRASKDGWDSKDFHLKCDNKSKTLIIINSDTNNIFGGYTSIPWTQDNRWHYDKNVFLFLIKSSKMYKAQIFNLIDPKMNAVYHYTNKSCWILALGPDLAIYANGNISNNSYTRKSYYNLPKEHYLNGNKYHSKIKEMEVFMVE